LTNENERAPQIDLDEVARLVAAIEQDLAAVRGGTADVETLRREVEQLRATLDAAPEDSSPLRSSLARIRDLLHQAAGELRADAVRGGQYVARIGGMLGM
jgi:ABC-type transporter Mla subunit MlaD